MNKFTRMLTFSTCVFSLLTVKKSWSAGPDDDWQNQLLYTTRALALHSGFLNGYARYRINFSGGTSELEFPLDVPVWGVKGLLGYKNSASDLNETARLVFSYLTNTSQDAGKMKDSDWIDDDIGMLRYIYGIDISQNHSGVDIYSESDTELKAEILAFDYLYNLYPNQLISFGPLAGYQAQKFQYRVFNTVQVGYGPYSSVAGASSNTKTLDYYVKYEIIYLGVGLISGDIKNLTFNAGFGYSPWAKSRDRDDHVARKKLSAGDAAGFAYVFKGDAEWHFAGQWALQVAGQYQKIIANGNQCQTFYDDPDLADVVRNVADNISTKNYFVSAGLVYYF
ncbi:MAG: omptin family outer membrane protease [Elusimicrobia bacterium]|nr:omptin family outer membrane protease [Elusimicrobiota bacterium]